METSGRVLLILLGLAAAAIAGWLWHLSKTQLKNSFPALAELLREEKFKPHALYTGPDTPEDGPRLVRLVNEAIKDVARLAGPSTQGAVRARLRTLIEDVDLFATEDREVAYQYAVRIWRAAGFTEASGLFPVPDERILSRY